MPTLRGKRQEIRAEAYSLQLQEGREKRGSFLHHPGFIFKGDQACCVGETDPRA